MNTSGKLSQPHEKSAKKSILLNRSLYGIFVFIGVYFSLNGSDLTYGIFNFGMALLFDPFDYRVHWSIRPHYQRVWLFVHAGILLSGLIYLLLFRFL